MSRSCSWGGPCGRHGGSPHAAAADTRAHKTFSGDAERSKSSWTRPKNPELLYRVFRRTWRVVEFFLSLIHRQKCVIVTMTKMKEYDFVFVRAFRNSNERKTKRRMCVLLREKRRLNAYLNFRHERSAPDPSAKESKPSPR